MWVRLQFNFSHHEIGQIHETNIEWNNAPILKNARLAKTLVIVGRSTESLVFLFAFEVKYKQTVYIDSSTRYTLYVPTSHLEFF